MKIPPALRPLLDDGIVDAVLRQLKSGKEAAVYVVRCGGEERCAKVYKDIGQRSFQNVAAYQEGRKSRGSRDSRAMSRRSRHGRSVRHAQWKSAESDALYALAAAGVRVPRSYGLFDGVLLMEMIRDADGDPAPRLNQVEFDAEQAREWHAFMVRQVVLMLCAGLIHGDLSEYNVLVDESGPVIIDLPQVVSAAGNSNAFAMLERDLANMRATFGAQAPELLDTDYAYEIWTRYENASLRPDTPLSGQVRRSQQRANVGAVLGEIEDARLTAEARERGRVEAERERGERD